MSAQEHKEEDYIDDASVYDDIASQKSLVSSRAPDILPWYVNGQNVSSGTENEEGLSGPNIQDVELYESRPLEDTPSRIELPGSRPTDAVPSEENVHSTSLGATSPVIGLPRSRPPDFTPSNPMKRKQSRSIIDVLGIGDRLDAAVDNESADDAKVAEFFRYKMNNKDRGIFVIFNHKKFSMKKANERTGTDIDKENLFETARELGFTVFTHDNLTVKELMKAIDQYAQIDYSDCDCFACAILTHGEAGDVLYAYDGKYSAKDLLYPFRYCSSLIGKPKLFFIQACRGTELDKGMKIADHVDAAGFADATHDDCSSIPVEADFVIAYSTVEGYYAWRNGENGSWFIQALCFCLRKYGDKMELLQIMTRVNRMVAYDFESCVSHPLYDKKKQMPSIVTRLTGDVYFHTPGIPMDCETIDGIFKHSKKSEGDRKREQDEQASFLKKQLLKTELDLVKTLKKKAEIELKEQDLREKLLEYKLATL